MVDFEGIMLDEISQTQKDKHCMISLISETKKTKPGTSKCRGKNVLTRAGVSEQENWTEVVKRHTLPVRRQGSTEDRI